MNSFSNLRPGSKRGGERLQLRGRADGQRLRIRRDALDGAGQHLARPTLDPEEIRRLLVEQVTGRVRWRESVDAARELVVLGLSCREGVCLSGVGARVAGDAIGADAFIANMAEDEFLKTLSKGGIEDANRALGIQPRNTGKEMRAALIQHVGQGSYVLPAACFGLTADEVAML